MVYRRVLVGTDGSETADKAVAAAADLARLCGAELHVATGFRGTALFYGDAMVDPGLAEDAERAARDVAEKAVATWGAGLTTKTHAAARPPVEAILGTAEEIDADLIVVGSKGMKGARRVLGSVPNSVAHGANCAVLVVKTR
jgi:nucleotide-binding universal stress UspA family protein